MKRVGILRGGQKEYYETSIKKGAELISYLVENLQDEYKVLDILIDKDNVWHVSGLPVMPIDLIHKVDIVWNMSHPNYGSIVSSLSIPLVGNSIFAMSLENNPNILKEHLNNLAINTPKHIILPAYQSDFDGPKEKYAEKKAKEVFNKFASPWIVRSYPENASVGIHVAQTFPQLSQAIEDVAHRGDSILVEELIEGEKTEMHTIRGFRGESLYTFPIENIAKKDKDYLNSFSKELHHHLGGEHYMNAHFVVHPRRGIFITSVNFSPNLSSSSDLDRASVSVGAKLQHIVEHILETA